MCVYVLSEEGTSCKGHFCVCVRVSVRVCACGKCTCNDAPQTLDGGRYSICSSSTNILDLNDQFFFVKIK